MTFQKMLDQLQKEEIFIEDITNNKVQFQEFASKIVTGRVDPNDPELEAFIKICNDVYTYSPDGEVLIPDSLYDQCMNHYKQSGNDRIVYADSIGKQWKLINHQIPGVVGSLDKAYTYKEIKAYLDRFDGITDWIIAPKYDGVSCAIHVVNGEIVSAATRYNGVQGQDITRLIKCAKNHNNFMSSQWTDDYYYKCELCVATDDFNELIKIKKYANRRSATSGIVNTPSNLDFARFITIIPLIAYSHDKHELNYIAPYKKNIILYSPSDFMDEVLDLLNQIKQRDFQFRVDGVVIVPDRTRLEINEADLMDVCIAYKVNTMEGRTRIKYGYMSVGRLGKAVPMLKVEPVEVNETTVEDISLGSYDKFLSMDLHENEEVIAYSAGDVIPQVKLPDDRLDLYGEPLLKIKRVCPYCEEKLERVNSEYYCMNPKCPRVITGKISNFLVKIGVEGFSDRTVEMIYEHLGVKSIKKFMKLTAEGIRTVPGFEETSSRALYNELQRVRNEVISPSKLIGALGIDKISDKKCKKIFDVVPFEKLINASDKQLKEYYWELSGSTGIGAKTASTFLTYISENREDIQKIASMFKIGLDSHYKGNVVYTGFRPTKEDEAKLKSIGYEVSNSVTSKTCACITASGERESTKMKAALKRGLPIYSAQHFDTMLEDLQKYGDHIIEYL